MKKVLYLYILNPVVLGGVIILALSLIFFVVTLMLENRQKFTTVSRASGTATKIVEPAMYTSLDEIKIVPRRINSHLFSPDLSSQYRQIFPEIAKDAFQKLIVFHTIEWAALRDLYSVNKLTLEGLQDLPEVTASQIEAEIPLLVADYQPRIMQLDGFFLKARFKGIYKKESELLNKTSAELQQIASQKIQDYIDQARKLKDPATILSAFNEDETIALMNNGELSTTFTDYQLDPPLFDDPDFFNTLEKAPVDSFSPVIILKTKNPLQTDLEEYAYSTFYITKRSGVYLPLTQIINEYVKVATVR